MAIANRAIDNLEQFIEVDPVSGCWRWIGALDGGYGRITVDGKRYQAHRFVYEQVYGLVIPPNYVLDHLCHTAVRRTCTDISQCMHRRCVNPRHMQPVSMKVNTKRGNAGRKKTRLR